MKAAGAVDNVAIVGLWVRPRGQIWFCATPQHCKAIHCKSAESQDHKTLPAALLGLLKWNRCEGFGCGRISWCVFRWWFPDIFNI